MEEGSKEVSESKEAEERNENGNVEEVEDSIASKSVNEYNPKKPLYETKERHNKKASKENNSKISSNKRNGLELLVSNLSEKAKELGIDETEYISSKLPKHSILYLENKSWSNSDESDGEDTINGAVILAYHIDKKTGKLEVLFEQKSPEHPTESGKLAPFGGAIKVGESSLEALIRELEEELVEPASSIIIEAFGKKGEHYERLTHTENGQVGYIDIYTVEIEDERAWQKVKYATTKNEAGPARVLPHDIILKDIHDKYFAFKYGPMIKGFVIENLPKQTTHTSYPNFKPEFVFAGNYQINLSLETIGNKQNPYANTFVPNFKISLN